MVEITHIFKGNLPKTVNVEYLMSTLKISESTARNTFRNLIILGLIDKDGKPKDRANDWRDDNHYPQVCEDITAEIYPQELQDIFHASSDRSALVSWFTRKTKIGVKAANKNAAIFEAILKGELAKPKEPKDRKSQPRSRDQRRSRQAAVKDTESMGIPSGDVQPTTSVTIKPEQPSLPSGFIAPSIHIDIQLHISPDAPTAQIEDIFKSIAKYLYIERKAGE